MQRPVLIGVGVLVALAALLFLWWPRPAEPPPVEPVPEPEPAPVEPFVPEPALPELDASDSLVREELGPVGLAGPLAAAADQEEMVRVFVSVVARVAAGRSPRSQLGFLEPDGYYVASERDGRLLVDPESFRRYDPLAQAVGSIDANAAAALFARIEPLADQAYAELGEPGAFRPVLLQALEVLLAAPVVELPIEVVDTIASYEYAARELEELSAAQKHLLRTGPDNHRRIREKLSELRDALQVR